MRRFDHCHMRACRLSTCEQLTSAQSRNQCVDRKRSAVLAEQRQKIEDVGDIGISIAVDISTVIDSK